MKRLNQEHETATKRRARYVWHICRYRQRFEMPDQYRRQMTGPLEFARDFIGSNAGMEAAKYQQQLSLLGEGREATLRFGLFRQLVGLASNQDRPYRGYLLDADCQPLSDSMLARLLKWKLAELRQELRELAAAGLIERVREPDYVEQDQAHLPPEGESEEERQAVRSSAPNCAKVRAPSRKRVKRKSEPKEKNENRNRKEKPERVSHSQDTAESHMKVQAQGESVSGGAGPCPPAPSQENPKPERNPQESEAGEAGAHLVPLPPPSARGAEPQTLGAIVSQRFPEHWQDPEAEAFGWDIVRALGLSTDRHNMVSRSNWGTFASWWCQVRARAPALGLGELRAIAIKQAQYIRTRNRTARKPGAVWMTIMEGELHKRGITLPPARAGPTAVG